MLTVQFTSTSGVTLECSPLSSIVLRSNSFHKLLVSGVAKESGVLIIKGCIVQAPNGAPQEFLLPVSTETEEDHRNRRRSMVRCESERTKYTGLDSLPWERGGKRFSATQQPQKTKPQYLECVVVPEQPLLRVRWTSLTHGALMLYNGERYRSHSVQFGTETECLISGLASGSLWKTCPHGR